MFCQPARLRNSFSSLRCLLVYFKMCHINCTRVIQASHCPPEWMFVHATRLTMVACAVVLRSRIIHLHLHKLEAEVSHDWRLWRQPCASAIIG